MITDATMQQCKSVCIIVESEGSTFMPAMAVLGIALPCCTIRHQNIHMIIMCWY